MPTARNVDSPWFGGGDWPLRCASIVHPALRARVAALGLGAMLAEGASHHPRAALDAEAIRPRSEAR